MQPPMTRKQRRRRSLQRTTLFINSRMMLTGEALIISPSSRTVIESGSSISRFSRGAGCGYRPSRLRSLGGGPLRAPPLVRGAGREPPSTRPVGERGAAPEPAGPGPRGGPLGPGPGAGRAGPVDGGAIGALAGRAGTPDCGVAGPEPGRAGPLFAGGPPAAGLGGFVVVAIDSTSILPGHCSRRGSDKKTTQAFVSLRCRLVRARPERACQRLRTSDACSSETRREDDGNDVALTQLLELTEVCPNCVDILGRYRGAELGLKRFAFERLLGGGAALAQIRATAPRHFAGRVDHNVTILSSDHANHVALGLFLSSADAGSHRHMFLSCCLIPCHGRQVAPTHVKRHLYGIELFVAAIRPRRNHATQFFVEY